MDKQLKKALTQQELRAMAEARKDQLHNHLAGLQSELSLADVNLGGQPVLDHVRERPLLVAGVALGAGALVGLLTGFLRRDRVPEPTPRELLLRAYLDDLVDDAGARVRRGDDADAALSKALRQRAPLVVMEHEREPATLSTSKQMFDLALKTALGFGIKLALDRLAGQLTGEEEIVKAVKHNGEPAPSPTFAPAGVETPVP